MNAPYEDRAVNVAYDDGGRLPRRQGRVTEEIKHLQDLIDQLGGAIDNLQDRLGPVLRDPRPAPPSDSMKAVPEDTGSAVGNQLGHHAELLAQHVRRARDILDRVDL